MNNRKQKNKRGKNPRQWVTQVIKARNNTMNLKNKIIHLTTNQ